MNTRTEALADYLNRLDESLEAEGDWGEDELIGMGVYVHRIGGFYLSDSDGVLFPYLQAEIEAQLKEIDFWRDDLRVEITETDSNLYDYHPNDPEIGLLSLEVWFTVSSGDVPLWNAFMNIDCEGDSDDKDHFICGPVEIREVAIHNRCVSALA